MNKKGKVKQNLKLETYSVGRVGERGKFKREERERGYFMFKRGNEKIRLLKRKCSIQRSNPHLIYDHPNETFSVETYFP